MRCAARLSPRLRGVARRQARAGASAAEIWRRVGREAERDGLVRPSYEAVRALVVDARAAEAPADVVVEVSVHVTTCHEGSGRRIEHVASCCSPRDYRRFFNRKQARRDAKRYRKKGLDKVSRRLLAAAGDLDGATVLEVGGGVGALGLEAVCAGAARATNVELSAGYEDEAAGLLREAELGDRVERRIGDFVVEADAVEPADVVLLNRVVCCYPDHDALLGAAADRARRRLAFSYPRDAWWTRAGARALNVVLALRRCGFRSYVHPAAELVAAAERRGLRVVERGAGPLWQVVALERPGES